MKIVCPNCGKKYNYEKFMGVCPACTKYTSFVDVQRQISGLAPEPNKQVNNSQQFVPPPNFPYDDHHQHHRESAPNENQHNENNYNYNEAQYSDGFGFQNEPIYQSNNLTVRQPKSPITIAIAIILVLIIVGVFAVPILVLAPREIATLNELQIVKDVNQITANVSEEIEFANLSFMAEQAEVVESDLFAAPAGWKYIYVPFTSTRTNDFTKYYYLYTYLNIDGIYIPALSTYEIPEYDYEDPFIYEQIDDLAIDPTIWGQEHGRLLFLVREDVSEYTMTIFSCVEEREGGRGVQTLETKLEIVLNDKEVSK